MLILAMSISGTIVFLSILICILGGKKVLSSIWIYNMLKMDLLFFCIPLPLFKSEYCHIISEVLRIPIVQNKLVYPIKNVIEISKEGDIFFDWEIYIVFIWIIWIAGFLFLYARHLVRYNNFKDEEKTIIQNMDYIRIFEDVKQELGINKEITLICADNLMTIYTAGITKKYIVIPSRGVTSEKMYYIFKHELIHIKRADIFFKYIAIFVMLIHWFNPLIYLYFYVMCIYCEKSCDAVLVCNLGKEERKKYGELIIDMALYEGKRKRQFAYFSSSKKIIEGRLKNMLKVKKVNKFIKLCSFFIGVFILFAGSLTVYAYEPPKIVTWQTESNSERLEDGQIEREFVSSTSINFSEENGIVIKEFVGENGSYHRVSELESTNSSRIFCIHSYVDGYYKEHIKYSDNSCKTDYYNAERCEKCGDIVLKSYSHTETSTKCTH